MYRRRGDYAPYLLNMLISWLIVVLALLHKVNAQADCDASERTVLKCNFPRNVNATQTDFSVYFQFDNGYEELLVDCVWLNHGFQCLRQEGFNITPQVLETAEITLPTRFVNAKGTYRCNLEGLEHKQGTPCRSGEKRQDKQVETQSTQSGGSIPGNNSNGKAADNYIPLIAGCVSGAVALCILGLIIIVTYKCVKKGSREDQPRTISETHLLAVSTKTNDATNADLCKWLKGNEKHLGMKQIAF